VTSSNGGNLAHGRVTSNDGAGSPRRTAAASGNERWKRVPRHRTFDFDIAVMFTHNP